MHTKSDIFLSLPSEMSQKKAKDTSKKRTHECYSNGCGLTNRKNAKEGGYIQQQLNLSITQCKAAFRKISKLQSKSAQVQLTVQELDWKINVLYCLLILCITFILFPIFMDFFL